MVPTSFALLLLAVGGAVGSPYTPAASQPFPAYLVDQASEIDTTTLQDLPGEVSTYEYVHHASYSEYSLRVTDPEPSLCDPSVKSHAGYLDVTDGKHLFFWFFESRRSPEKAPLTLWMNGGPGGSSSVGLFFELGPCRIANEGKNTTINPYGWNTYSNIIFLDQPVNVGYSYSTNGSEVNNSPAAAEDVYAFLQLFLKKYPEYADAPLHVAAESYGGTYGPHVGAEIHKRNKALSKNPDSTTSEVTREINLASIILANGHTDPKIQFAAVPDYVCDGPYALLESDGPECTAWRSKVPICQRLVQTCYDFDTPMTCTPAELYCWDEIYGPMEKLKRNEYDVRMPCDAGSEGNCYIEFDWIESWLNSTAAKKAIGIDPSVNFKLINFDVWRAFHAHGDSIRNSARLLPELINDGIRLLVYAGMADMACNFMGNEAWISALEHNFHAEFKNSTSKPWTTIESGRKAGEVRYAGGGGVTAGNVTFVKIYEAGHMVPFDQPEAALDLFTRWVLDVPLDLERPGLSSSLSSFMQ